MSKYVYTCVFQMFSFIFNEMNLIMLLGNVLKSVSGVVQVIAVSVSVTDMLGLYMWISFYACIY